MGIVKVSITYIQNNYPEVSITECNSNIIFEGHFVIEARHGDFEIHIAPRLRIQFPKNYPKELPVTFDIDNRITYDHKYTDGSLCLATEIDMVSNLHSSKCIGDYIEGFLIPYFISYEYWKKTGTDIFGDRAHGRQGIFETLRDFLEMPTATDKELYFLLTWAAKIQNIKWLDKSTQKELSKKYSGKIIRLRTLGIPFLRKQAQMLSVPL